MKVVRCKRCRRVLTNPLSQKRGYGAVCWQKSRSENHQQQHLNRLTAEVNQLKAKIAVLEKSNGTGNVTTMSHLEPAPARNIPVLTFEWDLEELRENKLFQKMAQLCV